MTKFFSSFATTIADLSGKPATFALAVALVLAWAISGPYFAYSETWQLVINTSTTIITFLMVFVLQNSQNRDGKALQALPLRTNSLGSKSSRNRSCAK